MNGLIYEFISLPNVGILYDSLNHMNDRNSSHQSHMYPLQLSQY